MNSKEISVFKRNGFGKSINRFTAADIFSGPGGLSLGFKQAGFSIIFAVEADACASDTYRFNHPEVHIFQKDIENLTDKEIKDALSAANVDGLDVLIAGPSCRGFSLANTRSRNEGNPSNYLFKHCVRILKIIKPIYFLFENVNGMHLMRSGSFQMRIEQSLRRAGYCVESKILNAVDYGVPQKRQRIFIIGSVDRKRYPLFFPKATHASAKNADELDMKPYVTVNDAISDLPKIGAGGGGNYKMKYGANPKTNYQKLMRGKSRTKNCWVYNHISTRSRDIIVKRFKMVPPGGNYSDIPLWMMRQTGYRKIHAAHSMIYKKLHPDEPSITITNIRKAMLQHPKELRIISVREAARIQSFPDNFIFCGGLGSQQQQVADAVPVILANKLAMELKKYL
ncbi:MAG: DNA cytosine methyltransferase [bacterium]